MRFAGDAPLLDSRSKWSALTSAPRSITPSSGAFLTRGGVLPSFDTMCRCVSLTLFATDGSRRGNNSVDFVDRVFPSRGPSQNHTHGVLLEKLCLRQRLRQACRDVHTILSAIGVYNASVVTSGRDESNGSRARPDCAPCVPSQGGSPPERAVGHRSRRWNVFETFRTFAARGLGGFNSFAVLAQNST